MAPGDTDAPWPTEVQITEVMAEGTACAVGQGLYVEVKNVSATRSFTLDGSTLELIVDPGLPPFPASSVRGSRVLAPGDRALVAPVPNCWSLVPDYEIDALAPSRPLRAVHLWAGVVSVVAASTSGSSLPYPWDEAGVALQLDDAAGRFGGWSGGWPIADPARWCRATASWTGGPDLGSPGAPNGSCPP